VSLVSAAGIEAAPAGVVAAPGAAGAVALPASEGTAGVDGFVSADGAGAAPVSVPAAMTGKARAAERKDEAISFFNMGCLLLLVTTGIRSKARMIRLMTKTKRTGRRSVPKKIEKCRNTNKNIQMNSRYESVSQALHRHDDAQMEWRHA
jgi:hypothetical protein